MPFQTANGLINAPITNIESISIGGLEIRNLAIAIHDAVPDPQIAGLLGLNFLTNFKTGYRYPERISAFRKEVAGHSPTQCEQYSLPPRPNFHPSN